MGLNIKKNIDGNNIMMKLKGKFDIVGAKDFDKAAASLPEGVFNVVLSLKDVKYLSSAGLRSLYMANKRVKRSGGEMFLKDVSSEVLEVLEVTQSDKVLTIIPADARAEKGEKSLLYPLLPMQRYLIDTQFKKARSTMENVGSIFRLEETVDLEIFAMAVNSMIDDVDIFHCRFEMGSGDGEMYQHFCGEADHVSIEEMPEDRFEEERKKLRQPFDMMGKQLWKMRIIKAGEKKYYFIDIFHALIDGVGMSFSFFKTLEKRYRNLKKAKESGSDFRKVTFEKPEESFSSYVKSKAGLKDDRKNLDAEKKYWSDMMAAFDKNKHRWPYDNEGKAEHGQEEIEIPMNNTEKGFFAGKDFSENTFFIAALMLSLARENKVRSSIFSWVYTGRQKLSELRIIGVMLNQIPLRWDFTSDMPAGEFLNALEKKIEEGKEYIGGLDTFYDCEQDEDTLCFILQKGALGRRGVIPFAGGYMTLEELPESGEAVSESPVDVELNVLDGGGYALVLEYDPYYYTEGSMRRLAASMDEMARRLQDADAGILGMIGDYCK